MYARFLPAQSRTRCLHLVIAKSRSEQKVKARATHIQIRTYIIYYVCFFHVYICTYDTSLAMSKTLNLIIANRHISATLYIDGWPPPFFMKSSLLSQRLRPSPYYSKSPHLSQRCTLMDDPHLLYKCDSRAFSGLFVYFFYIIILNIIKTNTC
jgi:hypothetical protein